MIFLKIIKNPLLKLSPLWFSSTISSFCFNLFSKPKISLAFFLVLSSIVFTSVAICLLFKSFNLLVKLA